MLPPVTPSLTAAASELDVAFTLAFFCTEFFSSNFVSVSFSSASFVAFSSFVSTVCVEFFSGSAFIFAANPIDGVAKIVANIIIAVIPLIYFRFILALLKF